MLAVYGRNRFGHDITGALASIADSIALGIERKLSEDARQVAETTRLFILAESLGGIESLMNYPAEMTHASVAGTELAVPDDLLRLSVGIEDAEDLVADLERALGSL